MTRPTSKPSPAAPVRRRPHVPDAAPRTPEPADARNEENLGDDGNALKSLGRAIASPVLESEPPQGGAPGASETNRQKAQRKR